MHNVGAARQPSLRVWYKMRPNTVAAAILGLFVVLALGVAAAVPLFEASDEPAHFLYAHGLVHTGVLPNVPTRNYLD